MIRVLLADDENLIRSALAALLALEDDLDVVAEAASAHEALAMARAHAPDVAVLDLQLPDRDGISLAAELVSTLPNCATVIVTGHGRPGHLKRALEAGVRGFLPKTVNAAVLTSVVRTVHAGGRYVDPELAAEAISSGDSPLTPREADVLELLQRGLTNAQIAHELSIGVETVRTHARNIYSKLGISTRRDLARLGRPDGGARPLEPVGPRAV